MSKSEQASLETDPRFPSGPWVGFFLQPLIPGRHQMELHLSFCQYEIKGEGRDWVGKFVIRGKYTLPDGHCHWTKRYIGKHDVFYQGFNEGKGIWGKWEILPGHGQVYQHGGFHIWPEGMPDPTGSYLTEAAEEPIPMVETISNPDRVAKPVGAVDTLKESVPQAPGGASRVPSLPEDDEPAGEQCRQVRCQQPPSP
jgi:hypothetical protein